MPPAPLPPGPAGGARLDAFLLCLRRDAVRALALLLAVAGLAVLPGGEAQAADRWDFEMGLDARDVWFRRMPQLSLHSTFTTSTRTLSGGSLPSTGAQQFAALNWDCGAAWNGRYVVPAFGFQFGWAAGQSSEVVTALDGSIVHMHPWSAELVTLLLPGFGVRQKARRWMFEAVARPVVSIAFMNAMVASGADQSNLSSDDTLFAATLGLRADLEVCRRIDPVERACLVVSPALYEFSSLNGGSIGLRWEVGP